MIISELRLLSASFAETTASMVDDGRFAFAEVNALVLSNQTKDSPGLEVRHRCNGKQREWAYQQRQNEPTDPADSFVASRNGADKANNNRRHQPKKKQHSQALQSLPCR